MWWSGSVKEVCREDVNEALNQLGQMGGGVWGQFSPIYSSTITLNLSRFVLTAAHCLGNSDERVS